MDIEKLSPAGFNQRLQWKPEDDIRYVLKETLNNGWIVECFVHFEGGVSERLEFPDRYRHKDDAVENILKHYHDIS